MPKVCLYDSCFATCSDKTGFYNNPVCGGEGTDGKWSLRLWFRAPAGEGGFRCLPFDFITMYAM